MGEQEGKAGEAAASGSGTETAGFSIAAFKELPRIFWIVNALELLERGAFYGMMGILSWHMKNNLGMQVTDAGMILNILFPFLYITPIFSGALMEKYGYRIMLVPAYAICVAGYALVGLTKDFWQMAAGLVVIGLGTGMLKPIPSSTIAHSTSDKMRNFGYSVYYWMINVGSFAVPLAMAFAIPTESYGTVFFLSSGLMTVNFVLALLLFRDPVSPNRQKQVGATLKEAASVVFGDKRFLTLVMIYSGFWFMYSMNNVVITNYMTDFKAAPDWFSPLLANTVNPLTIIAIGFWLGTKLGKYNSLHYMAIGIAIYVLGTLLMGIAPNFMLFVSGIVIFSIGEFVTHPTYISYVSKIAPKEKLPLYMGFGFLPILIGYETGNLGGAYLYKMLAEEAHRPKLFWTIICCVGLVTIACLLIYIQTRGVTRKEEETAKEVGKGEPVVRTGADAHDRRRGGTELAFLNSRVSIVAVLIIIPAMLGGAYAGGSDPYYFTLSSVTGSGTSHGKPVSYDGWEVQNGSAQASGDVSENSKGAVVNQQMTEKNMAEFTATITWTDEPDSYPRHENQPDELGVEIVAPWGENKSASAKNTYSSSGGSGSATVTIQVSQFKYNGVNGTGTWNVTPFAKVCGDNEPKNVGLLKWLDNGNSYSLAINWKWHVKAGTKK